MTIPRITPVRFISRSLARLTLLLIIGFILFFPIISFPQQPHLKFEHLNREEGLSNSFVYSFLQDSKGFIWIGTSEGLNRYDGYEFEIFKSSDDPNSISQNVILNLTEDSDGNIWIATLGGLNMFDREKEIFVKYQTDPSDPNSISSNHIVDVVEDENGDLWIGTNGGDADVGGVNHFDRKNNKFTNYFTCAADSIQVSNEGIYDVFIDSRGIIWVATGTEGLKRFNRKTKTFRTYSHDPYDTHSISSNNITKIFEDSRKNLWVCTRNAGLCLLDRETGNFTRFKKEEGVENSLPGNILLSIEEDSEGNLWIGTDNSGLSVFNPEKGTFYNYNHDPGNLTGLNNKSIYCIMKDARGAMWLGTFSGGVNLFNIAANRFVHYSATKMGLNRATLFDISEDSRGNILLATDGGGLNIYDRKTGNYSYMMHDPGNPNSISGNNVLSALEDSYHNIWVGTWGDGVTMFNKAKGTYRHFKNNPEDPASLSSDNAWTIFEDSRKNIWIGTYWGGLSMYDRKADKFIQYKMAEDDVTQINSHLINCITEDPDGNIWIGTLGGGLDMLDQNTNTFTHHTFDPNSNSIMGNNVTSLLVDTTGNLWIGTTNGLSYLDRDTNSFTNYIVNGNKQVRGLLNDGKGNLWISTNDGLSRFHVKNKEFQNFTVADGLQASEFAMNAAWRCADGTMYFGGINGFNEFHPDNLTEENYNPPVVLTDIQIFNESVPIGEGTANDRFSLSKSITETKQVTLTYKESVITLEFASLDYNLKSRKVYAYKLEGFDQKWNEIGSKRTATYTNLSPGEYTFRVRSANSDRVWSQNRADLMITITPPFWSTWWFRTLIGLFVLGLAYGGYSYTMSIYKAKLINNQKIELEKQVIDRTRLLTKANEKLVSQKENLAAHARRLKQANIEIERHRFQVEKLYTELKDSIRAAEVIQNTILPSSAEIKKYLPESFVLYQPKDTVSGDFYWFGVVNERIIIAAADCAGHGVSGALMSINGYHFLNRVIYRQPHLKPSEILNQLQREMAEEIHDETNQSGMDIALCVLDLNKFELQYAGAACPLYMVRNGKLIQVKSDRFGIDCDLGRSKFKFINHVISLQKDDVVYLFSDGFADQIGGPQQTKFMYPRFRELLQKISGDPLNRQAETLNRELISWRGDFEQLDDILVLGFKVSDERIPRRLTKEAFALPNHG